MAGRPTIRHGESRIKGGIGVEMRASDANATHRAHVDLACVEEGEVQAAGGGMDTSLGGSHVD